MWQRISGDPVLSRPPVPGSPGNVGAGQDLRLDIGWDRFEQLLVSVAQGILGLDQMRFRRYGVSGQQQHGIDLAGRHPDSGDYTVVFGDDAYPDVWHKAAALMESAARNHVLVDGNKRIAWYVAWVYLYVNGFRLDANFDVYSAEQFVLNVCQGEHDVPAIAEKLRSFVA